jgi:hypothetical protein
MERWRDKEPLARDPFLCGDADHFIGGAWSIA